jgi:hypothetical protein
VLLPNDAGNRVLNMNFVHVQKGNGAVIESPAMEVILVDSGGSRPFGRYLAARFGDTSAANREAIHCILINPSRGSH